MLLFLSISGIFLSAILLYFNPRDNRSTLYLGLFFLFLSLYSLYQYILLYSKSVTLVSLFLFNIAIVSSPLYLIGPMLFWYIRSVLTDNARLTRRDLWHLVPMIIFFMAALPHAFIPWHEKVEAARTVVADAGFMGEYRATLLAKIFSPTLEYLTRPVLVLGYTLWSAGLFIHYLIRKKSSVVLSKQQFMKKWLFLLLIFLLTLEVTQMLLIIRAFEMHFSELYFAFNVLRLFSVTGLIGLFISPFFFPVILYGLPRIPGSMMEVNEENRSAPSPPDKKNKNHNTFEETYLISIGQKAEACMMEHRPYLQPDCNLGHLAEHVNLPVHHLAYYFREIKKQRFTDYRNEWRINHAKNLIRQGKANEITLEAIGMLSGFSSRNAFIADFKKMEGISPGVFADRVN
jgi:AraC-like DNA-binding protein